MYYENIFIQFGEDDTEYKVSFEYEPEDRECNCAEQFSYLTVLDSENNEVTDTFTPKEKDQIIDIAWEQICDNYESMIESHYDYDND